ncbi:MAG: hypothetical protein DRJ62_07625, partial [Thermoprotei archaeon]
YGVRVLYHGTEVYYERDEIDVLYETEFIDLIVHVYKLKLVFVDCHDNLIPDLWFEYTLPNGHRDWDHATDEGEYDFPYLAGGTLTIHHAWWKGVELPLMEAKDATGEELPLTDGELVIDVEEGVDAPITIKIPIKDLIFYTTDFQGEMNIPRLNITLTWVGTYKPWTDEKVYFLETLDPTGDTEDVDGDGIARNDYNTSIVIHPLWFKYDVDAFFHKIADDSPMEGLAEWEAKYVFYKMPPAIYNITVTTVTDVDAYGENPDSEDRKGVTPGTSKWPGRTDMEVPYEIKIDWEWAESYEDSVPSIRTGPADVVNDRVVLRIFGSMGGVPVTAENFPADLVEAWNPDLIGNLTALVCEEEITLKTWAHDFWKRVINGDLRVGDAEFDVMNDNGMTMTYYDITEEKWSTRVSKWTEDIKDVSAIMKDSHYTSNIYWNGSYLLTELYFETNMTYAYNHEGKAENASFVIDKFFNASMTSDATPGADGYWSPNQVDPILNFTLVGTEKLWKTSRRFPYWAARIEGNTWKDWYPAWFLVYELPSPDDEYVVEAGEDGKGILPVPIPVAFIKLKAFAKDGSTPLANALIELWALHMDVADDHKVEISAADSGTGTLDFGPTDVEVEWEWEKKLKESGEPQIFEETRWDRIWITFTIPEEEECEYEDVEKTLTGVVLNFTGVRDTRISVDEEWELVIHLVGTNTTTNEASFTVELVHDGDLVGSETSETSGGVATYTVTFEGTELDVEITLTGVDDKGAVFDVEITGTVAICEPVGGISKTIFVQVPPAPAKLILRNVIKGYDVAISEDYIYPLLDKPDPVDRNTEAMIPEDRSPSTFMSTDLQTDEWATPDGLLAYGRWYTDEDGYVDSFKDLGPDDPRYGSVVLPIAGWLNETFHDGSVGTEDEFHYQLNVVWKSAVVYSD